MKQKRKEKGKRGGEKGIKGLSLHPIFLPVRDRKGRGGGVYFFNDIRGGKGPGKKKANTIANAIVEGERGKRG